MNGIDIIGYVDEKILIVVAVLFILGLFLKSIPNIKDWTIPFMLVIIGIGLSIFILEDGVQAIMQGILAAGVAVLTHQVLKQTISKRGSDKTTTKYDV